MVLEMQETAQSGRDPAELIRKALEALKEAVPDKDTRVDVHQGFGFARRGDNVIDTFESLTEEGTVTVNVMCVAGLESVIISTDGTHRARIQPNHEDYVKTYDEAEQVVGTAVLGLIPIIVSAYPRQI